MDEYRDYPDEIKVREVKVGKKVLVGTHTAIPGCRSHQHAFPSRWRTDRLHQHVRILSQAVFPWNIQAYASVAPTHHPSAAGCALALAVAASHH
jgi:hypothetical protein